MKRMQLCLTILLCFANSFCMSLVNYLATYIFICVNMRLIIHKRLVLYYPLSTFKLMRLREDK